MRLTKKEAIDLIKNADLLTLQKLAYTKKKQLHKDNITTFVVDRNINYTNICCIKCKFCAFYVDEQDPNGYILSFEQIDKKIEELIQIGGSQILFQGGVHPKLKIDFYENLVSHIHNKFPQITIHGFSAVEIDFIAKLSKISTKEVLQRLQDKGLFSIPGAGAEVLSDRVREIISPHKLSTKAWLDIHKNAHNIGMKTTATMMYGTVESIEEIVEHLSLIRDLQDETGGFRAFIMWSFQPHNTQLYKEGIITHKTSSNRYLRYLAVARLFLDNFENIQSSWVTQGSYIGQLALLYGANDLGSVMMEENVVASTGVRNSMNVDEMVNLIKDIGEIPAQRNTDYSIIKTF
ncbi:MAG: dehypoxanthine futalosine cyclase [Epsilonproteobacteria bacterium]|nr:dehypoxanthine futalosine cyclase [Campylobacterota bacterium]